MNEETVLLSDLTWKAYKRRVDAGVTVIIPVGAIEQHGPHLPLGTDAMLTAEMGKRIAKRVGGLVAPLIPYGYKSQPKSGGGNHFPGTTSFDGQTLEMAVEKCYGRRSKIATPGADVIHFAWLHVLRYFRMSPFVCRRWTRGW